MRADAVRGEQPTLGIAVECEGLSAVIETEDILAHEVSRRAHLDPSLHVGGGFAAPEAFLHALPGRGENTLHVVGWICHLTDNCRQDFAPGGQNRRIRRRAVVLYQGVQLGQSMERYQREHVVLQMIVHVPVNEPAHRIHVDRSAIETVIEYVFRQARMLRRIVPDHHPRAEKMGQND